MAKSKKVESQKERASKRASITTKGKAEKSIKKPVKGKAGKV